MGNNDKHLAILICSNRALKNQKNGMSQRVLSLKSLLEENHFDCAIFSQKDYFIRGFRKKAHLGVMVGFSSGWLTYILSKRVKFLWLDAMDSRNLLIKADIRNPINQLISVVRESLIKLKYIQVVTFISCRDKEADICLYGNIPKFIVPNKIIEPFVNKGGESKLVFVGPANYKPNLESVKFLARERLEKRIVDDIYIIGSGYNKLLSDKEHQSLVFLGYVRDEDLYWENDIHLAPIFHGAGVKNKALMPLLSGLRVVGTQEAFNGLRIVNNMFLVRDINQFALNIEIAKRTKPLPPSNVENLYLSDETSSLLSFLAEGLRD